MSDGELMRSDAKPCSRLMRHTAGIFSVGGALGFWVLCRLHYGTAPPPPPHIPSPGICAFLAVFLISFTANARPPASASSNLPGLRLRISLTPVEALQPCPAPSE